MVAKWYELDLELTNLCALTCLTKLAALIPTLIPTLVPTPPFSALFSAFPSVHLGSQMASYPARGAAH